MTLTSDLSSQITHTICRGSMRALQRRSTAFDTDCVRILEDTARLANISSRQCNETARCRSEPRIERRRHSSLWPAIMLAQLLIREFAPTDDSRGCARAQVWAGHPRMSKATAGTRDSTAIAVAADHQRVAVRGRGAISAAAVAPRRPLSRGPDHGTGKNAADHSRVRARSVAAARRARSNPISATRDRHRRPPTAASKAGSEFDRWQRPAKSASIVTLADERFPT